jgi:23S rRNA (cytidine1920-2'-O)/16S rRNA (cytidine1409-2'-O)-methyltransferase
MPTANAKNNDTTHPRGYCKIASAARSLGVDFGGKIILDIGSSTGGFSEYALERGAKKVIAVEKGTNQMRISLRHDSRIELHEKTDIFDFEPTQKPDLILADLSFISLTSVLKYISQRLSGPDTEIFAMLKPQFEAKPQELTKGIVKNEKIRRNIIKNFEQWLKSNSFVILGKRDNELSGRHGNTERFYHLKLATCPSHKTSNKIRYQYER